MGIFPQIPMLILRIAGCSSFVRGYHIHHILDNTPSQGIMFWLPEKFRRHPGDG